MVIYSIVLLCIILVYRFWFFPGTLASGDWPYLFKETIQNFSFIPIPSFLWLGPYYQITSKIFVEYFHMSWELTERLLWFFMFLVISFSSSWYFSKTVFNNYRLCFLSILIFLTNSYILMIVAGGQVGVALGYAFAPSVLTGFIQYTKKYSNKNLIIACFLLALQVMFDPRIAYVTSLAIFVYFLFSLFIQKDYRKQIDTFIVYVFWGTLTILTVNSFWIIGQIFDNNNTVIPFLFGKSSSLSFFSFGSFSQAISLLHPNWPENIFGKTYFLKPEFLFIPLITFSSLLFMKKEEKLRKEMLFFLLLGLVGVFLSKGVQEPFPEIYQWMFLNIPGFALFRDPTKFYLLIVLSYAILIPFSIEKLSEKILPQFRNKKILNLTIILFILYWMVLMRPSLFGELSGTFKPHPVPSEYILLKDFLVRDTQTSSILWVPMRSPFSFFSALHPLLDSTSIFETSTPSAIPALFRENKLKNFLKEYKIKYIVVPDDTERKIFLTDRRYDERLYKQTVTNLAKITYLSRVASFGKIMVFQVHQ